MIKTQHTDIYDLSKYASHLKSLTKEDKHSRFGVELTDASIDQLILRMVYSPSEHELWCSVYNGEIAGFGHLARNPDGSWELAVSVNKEHQQKGVGDSLIGEMLSWAKFHEIPEVFMHCIEDNRVIQHLAEKHNLKLRLRDHGERTSSIEVPAPNVFEVNSHILKEQIEIYTQIGELREKLTKLWFDRKV